MSKDAELETSKLSGYKDKGLCQQGEEKQSRMREEAVYSYTLNFQCNLKVPNFVICLFK